MWRAREDEADRYCGPLFFTLWKSDVLPADCLGRGEMDRYKMEKKNMKHMREEDRFGFRVDDSSLLSDVKKCVLWHALLITQVPVA